MIDYYESLLQEEQEEIKEVIQILFRQTFLLERKYDKRSGRLQYVKEYRIVDKHFEFLKVFFQIAGFDLCQNVHTGMIYIQGEMVWGEKLSRLTTIYLLVLKLLYDEQMETASSSNFIVTTMGALNGKAGDFKALKSLPSQTEMRRTISILKKYQIIEPMDILEELNEHTRLIIYPSINAVLMGDSIRELLNSFHEEETIGEDTAVQGTFKNLSE